MSILYHRKNEIAVDLSDLNSVGAIDIYYTGKLYGESFLPEDWQVMAHKDRILCISFGNTIPELLLNYTGLINIRGATAIGRDLIKHPISIIVEGIDYWGNFRSDFDKQGQIWNDLGGKHEPARNIIGTHIVRNGLKTNPGEFFFESGAPYNGDYHQHQDGQAMSGAEHEKDSKLIYRKDSKGKIFNPRKKMSKSQRTQLIKSMKEKINIPEGRGRAIVPDHYKPSPTGKGSGGGVGHGGGGGGGGY